MDVGRSFSFPFREPHWFRRLLAGAVLEIAPLLVAGPLIVSLIENRGRWSGTVGFGLLMTTVVALVSRWIQYGYLRRIAQRTMAGDGGGLPAWDRLDSDLADGFRLWVAAVGLFIPALAIPGALALLLGSVGLTVWLWFPLAFVLPLAILATVLYLPAALANTVSEDSVLAAFDIEAVTSRTSEIAASYVLALVVALATEILAQFGLLLLCVGIFPARFLAHCITVHAVATAWAEQRTTSVVTPT